MNTKHTDGIWEVKGRGFEDHFRVGLKNHQILTIATLIANEADARLIAAAPDMLETLRDIVGMLIDANDMRADALHVARAAIVRATGGQA